MAYLAWKKDYWKQFLEAIQLSPKPNTKVLDAGCGPAGIFTALENCSVTAVDPLLSEYEKLDHFSRASFLNVQFLPVPLEGFSAEQSFDYVFCLNVINHVRDLEGVSRVLAKAAKENATVVISVDAHRHRWLKPIFKLVPGDILHPHQFDLEEYVDLFSKAGLDLVSKLLYREEFLFDYWVLTLKPTV